MIGMVLAAGAGRRLRPYTDTLPKTLVLVDSDRTILDIALANLKAAGLADVAVVTGYAAGAVEERKDALERRHGVKLELVFNPKAEEWNNAYSLWCARELFGEGVLLVNGDTVHPPSVEQTLLASRGPDILLALDDAKALGEEEMKVHLSESGHMTRINKALDPAAAPSINVRPMYSPCAVAGSSALLIRIRCPSAESWTFISSSPSALTSSSASRMPGPRDASSVASTLGGWTVSPLTSRTPAPNRWRAHQSE